MKHITNKELKNIHTKYNMFATGNYFLSKGLFEQAIVEIHLYEGEEVFEYIKIVDRQFGLAFFFRGTEYKVDNASELVKVLNGLLDKVLEEK